MPKARLGKKQFEFIKLFITDFRYYEILCSIVMIHDIWNCKTIETRGKSNYKAQKMCL